MSGFKEERFILILRLASFTFTNAMSTVKLRNS